MPIETKRQAEVLKKLQDVIKHTDRDIAAGRKLAIKRWAETYIEHIKSFKDDKLEFLYNVFRDEGCWLGTRLNNTVLGQRFTEEKIGGIDNPLHRYEMACSYCVVGKILPFFQKRFEFLKSKFPPGKFDGKTETEIDKYVRNSLLDTIKRNGRVFDFWIDRESGGLKQPSTASEGFDSAVKLKWSEGVEYFYNHLKEEDKEKKLTEAIIALSRPQSVEKDASILDFCVNKIVDKDTLLQKVSQKDRGVYFLFSRLIRSCFFDTVHDLVQCWCYKEVSERGDGDHSEKIFSYEEYKLLLSSLSNVMLDNPELNAQARSLIMEMWRCGRFYKHKEAAVNTSNYTVPTSGVFAGLIVNWRREDIYKTDEEKEIGKKEILDMMSFAKDCFPEKFALFKEVMIKNLRLCGRKGMKEDIDYGDSARELFSELERTIFGPRGDGPWNNLRLQSKVPLPLDGSGDGPKSGFEAPSVSGVSGSHKKGSIFTLSGNE
ncbi:MULTISPECIES: cytoplasmic incompatibility factor CifA [Wolbachia]|uniref:cytoplasmic incompatibility factor CifA n=1 Tax=Wolbachia TaxID=953 RepID=UPI0015FDEB9E|nr:MULTISPECIES: cytoplasmic incompatibility factor CifA [Wolbachia]MBA8756962.1 cytoplasmic incompatibility factor CifA [Wolbachia pipientis]MDE5058968.1 cytoplasmic incompatibility factor CifA [Wolbachia endosymbiont of Drosophila baimaii]